MDHSVDHAELVGFLSSFYDEACDLRSGWLRRWIDHFEVLFGADVASVSSLRNLPLLVVSRLFPLLLLTDRLPPKVHAVGNDAPTRWEETSAAVSVDEVSQQSSP